MVQIQPYQISQQGPLPVYKLRKAVNSIVKLRGTIPASKSSFSLPLILDIRAISPVPCEPYLPLRKIRAREVVGFASLNFWAFSASTKTSRGPTLTRSLEDDFGFVPGLGLGPGLEVIVECRVRYNRRRERLLCWTILDQIPDPEST